jgi:hypothetical protein
MAKGTSVSHFGTPMVQCFATGGNVLLGSAAVAEQSTPVRDLTAMILLIAEIVAANILAGAPAANDAEQFEGNDERRDLRPLLDGQAEPNVD